MTGRHFEEFVVGEKLVTAARTITIADVMGYAGLSGDFNPVHTDAIFASTTPFGARLVHGPLVMCIALGLFQRTGVTDGTTIALLDISEWTFRKPVFIDDTVHAEMTIADARRTSNPARGVIVRSFEVFTRRAADDTPELVQTGRSNLMVRCRPNEQVSDNHPQQTTERHCHAD